MIFVEEDCFFFCVSSEVKGLGDSDSGDEGAAAWVQKSRKIQKEKELAEKRVSFIFILET